MLDYSYGFTIGEKDGYVFGISMINTRDFVWLYCYNLLQTNLDFACGLVFMVVFLSFVLGTYGLGCFFFSSLCLVVWLSFISRRGLIFFSISFVLVAFLGSLYPLCIFTFLSL